MIIFKTATNIENLNFHWRVNKMSIYGVYPMTVETTNREALEKARQHAANSFQGQMYVGRDSITFLTEEAAKAMSSVTGAI